MSPPARPRRLRLRAGRVLPLAAEARPTIDATLNGSHVCFLVDTGAELSTVTPEAVLSLQLLRDRHRSTILTTIDGQETGANAILSPLSIADLKYSDRSVAIQPLRRDDGDKRAVKDCRDFVDRLWWRSAKAPGTAVLCCQPPGPQPNHAAPRYPVRGRERRRRSSGAAQPRL